MLPPTAKSTSFTTKRYSMKVLHINNIQTHEKIVKPDEEEEGYDDDHDTDSHKDTTPNREIQAAPAGSKGWERILGIRYRRLPGNVTRSGHTCPLWL